MKTVVLLVDPARAQSEAAVTIAHEFFEVRQVQRHVRTETRIWEPLISAGYLLNFLSAPYVPQKELDKFWDTVNFHPGPPEYPGVGAASRALYDKRTTYGVTAHRMNQQYDNGTILRVRTFDIDPTWGYKALWDQALKESLALFIDVCAVIAADGQLRTYWGGWARQAMTRQEFEAHPSYERIAQ